MRERWRRPPRYSIRSLARSRSIVCHCMLTFPVREFFGSPMDLEFEGMRLITATETVLWLPLGDHLLRRRLVLKLLQRQVAEQLCVDKASITNWEGNRTKPGVEYMPAIIRFLGYNPLPPPDGWAERLVRCRTILGLTQNESASRIGVDQCTLARWERGEREPTGAFEARALTFVGEVDATCRRSLALTA
jgi:transcriptional regulator with XRE-family HTH domain